MLQVTIVTIRQGKEVKWPECVNRTRVVVESRMYTLKNAGLF